MENKNKSSAGDTFTEQSQQANKWFQDSVSAMTDIYNKQLNTATDFYKNFFQSAQGENKNFANPYAQFSEFFMKSNPFKSMFNPLNAMNMGNPFLSPYEQFIKQVTDYNQGLFNSLKGAGVGIPEADWKGINEQYRRMLEGELQVYSKVTQLISTEYKKRMDEAIKTNIEMSEEVNRLMNEAATANREFWSYLFKQYQVPFPGNKENSGTSGINGSKQNKTK